MKIGSLTLGVLTAIGGFVDMGNLVTASQAGAQYRFALMWTVVVGTLGVIVYADMAGRVAIASGRSLFDVIRERLGIRLALIPLAGNLFINVLTLVVEIAGMALVLQIVTGITYLVWYPVAALVVVAILWFASFKFVENVASLLGLAILVFVVAAFKLATPWDQVARQAVLPLIPPDQGQGQALAAYGFSAISLLGALIAPYEVAFYSSGAIEEKWEGKDIITNRVTAIVGMSFGALITVAMIVAAAQTFYAHGLQSQTFVGIRLPLVYALGKVGLGGFLLGAFATTSGAALETALATSYTLCQFFGWDWGQNHNPKEAPTFTLWYLLAILMATIIAISGIDPVRLTIYTMALGAFSLPFTFAPLLIIANDTRYMGNQRNGRLANVAGIFFLVVLTLITILTLPLLILSGGGGG